MGARVRAADHPMRSPTPTASASCATRWSPLGGGARRRTCSRGRFRSSARRGTGCSTTSTACTSAGARRGGDLPRKRRRGRGGRRRRRTGMICHGFKGGIGSASRVWRRDGGYTVGVLVQANHGWRERLTVRARRSGRAIGRDACRIRRGPERRRRRLDHRDRGHRRAAAAAPVPAARPAGSLGIARTGGVGEHSSGDIMLAFSTAPQGLAPSDAAGDRSPSPCRSRCSWTPTSARSTTRRSRPRRPRSSTRCWPPRPRRGGAG